MQIAKQNAAHYMWNKINHIDDRISNRIKNENNQTKIRSTNEKIPFKGDYERISDFAQNRIIKRVRNLTNTFVDSYAKQFNTTIDEYLSLINFWESSSSFFDGIEIWLFTAFHHNLESAVNVDLRYVSSFLIKTNDLNLKNAHNLIHNDCIEFSVWIPLFVSERYDKFCFINDDKEATYEFDTKYALAIKGGAKFTIQGATNDETDRCYLVSQWKQKYSDKRPMAKLSEEYEKNKKIREAMITIFEHFVGKINSRWILDDYISKMVDLIENKTINNDIVDVGNAMHALIEFPVILAIRQTQNAFDCEWNAYNALWNDFLTPVLNKIKN